MLLITGASGVGKSTVRRRIQAQLSPLVEAVELTSVAPMPERPTLAWRQETVERVVRRALILQAQGRHLLLAGDPVPPGEVLAAPSARWLDAFAACLLDVQPHAQRERLARRGDPAALWPHHIAFAEWLREHARDPQHRQHVIRQDGWPGMRWERWSDWREGDSRWRCAVIDTTNLSPAAVARAALAWCRAALEESGVA